MDLGFKAEPSDAVTSPDLIDAATLSNAAIAPAELSSVLQTSQRIPTPKIRTSLKASTVDGVFAAIFSNITGGVLLSNFLVNLQANSFEIGVISAIPMLANFVQPVGAWLGDRFSSRQLYCTSIYLPSRLVWVSLPIGIVLYSQNLINERAIAIWTIAVVSISHLLGGLGSAAWLSWMAALVPRQLRGRYFGIRNSAANLTSLVVVVLSGIWVARYPRGELEGFAIALGVSIVAGVISLACQQYMVDVHPHQTLHPQSNRSTIKESGPTLDPESLAVTSPISLESARPLAPLPANDSCDQAEKDRESEQSPSAISVIWSDRKYQAFLLYFSIWMFALNFSAPFFNIYLLQDLSVNVSQVTLYNSLAAAANLVFLIPFGRWSDRIGNRIPLVGMGLIMAILPLVWLWMGTDLISLWIGFPLLFIFNGGASAVIDLCGNNLQIDIAHAQHQTKYFGLTAAIAGVSGALGTLTGGSIAHLEIVGGLTGLFAISGVLRLLSLVPLFWVQEHRAHSFFKHFSVSKP